MIALFLVGNASQDLSKSQMMITSSSR